jgi:hypothetical protein
MTNFVLTAAPDKLPAVDFLTQSANGPFVDTGYDYRDRAGRVLGRVYLSVDTIRHLADVAGVLTPTSDEAIRAAYNKGVLDGVKEDLGGDLARIADVLQRSLEPASVPVGVAL